jgi:hypothetical protein
VACIAYGKNREGVHSVSRGPESVANGQPRERLRVAIYLIFRVSIFPTNEVRYSPFVNLEIGWW